MNYNPLITEIRLNQEADNPAFAEILSGLMFRLVTASVNEPKELRIPFAGGIGQSGFDGIVESNKGYKHFVPDGKSVWEWEEVMTQDKKRPMTIQNAQDKSRASREENYRTFASLPGMRLHGQLVNKMNGLKTEKMTAGKK